MSTSQLDDGGGGGGGTSDTDDDSTSSPTDGSGGDSGGFFSGVVTGWGDLSLPTTLQSFLSNPQGFIIGAVATAILEQIFGLVTTLLNVVFLVFGGSAPGDLNAPGETLGLIDIPVAIADLIIGTGSEATDALVGGIESLNEPVFALASAGGLAAPVIIVGVLVVEVIAVLWLLQRAVFIIADWLQLGGLTQ